MTEFILQYLLQQLGISCYYCTGYASQSHAWNTVVLDDSYYNCRTYDYFNKTDADYAGNRIRQDLSVYLPPCNGQTYRDMEKEDDMTVGRDIWEMP